MRKELDEKLCEQFPLIFADRHKDPSETCMYWGFECGDGWYNIIYALCRTIQNHIDNNRRQIEWANEWNAKVNDPDYKWDSLAEREPRDVPKEVPQVVAMQVKEKFGSLRFYVSSADDEVFAMIDMAENMSCVTCEVCGSPGELRNEGWMKTLCDEHKDQ